MYNIKYDENLNSYYSLITEKDIENYLFVLKKNMLDDKAAINRLKKENARMKEKVYATEAMRSLQEENNKLRKALNFFGFSHIERLKDVAEWQSNHVREKHNNSSEYFEYIIEPTYLGSSCVCKCKQCGEEFEFQEVGE